MPKKLRVKVPKNIICNRKEENQSTRTQYGARLADLHKIWLLRPDRKCGKRGESGPAVPGPGHPLSPASIT